MHWIPPDVFLLSKLQIQTDINCCLALQAAMTEFLMDSILELCFTHIFQVLE